VKRVLVIDDSSAVRQQIRNTLASAGFEIVEAMDGLDGLEKLRTMTDINLALCDVNMPRMTGLEMMLEVQREGLTTPILMLTTEGQPSMIRRARDAGAKGWIVKPFKPELLLIAVNKIVGAKTAQ
jgi:two-component system, chemotaxis family, chemotaxis protein CheY